MTTEERLDQIDSKLDRVLELLDKPDIVLAPADYTPAQIAELNAFWTKWMEIDSTLRRITWVPGEPKVLVLDPAFNASAPVLQANITYEENTHGN